MPRFKSAIGVLLVAMVTVGSLIHAADPTTSPSPSFAPSTATTVNLKVGDLDRDYLVYVPKSYIPDAPPKQGVPLVLMLHGAGGGSQGTMKRYEWPAKADKEGFIVVFPQATKPLENQPDNLLTNPRVWNDASGRGFPARRNTDDVGYIRAVIDDVQAKFKIDDKRIYITGFSSGASMTSRLGIELADKVAAVAPVSGHLWIKDPKPSRTVPYMLIVGTDDPLNPIDGGVGVNPWKTANNPPKPAMRENVDAWRKLIGASDPATIVRDNAGVRIERYTPAGWTTQPAQKDGAPVNYGPEVVYIIVEGLGHSWPGCKEALPESLVGKTSNKIDATDVIWEFFSHHAK